MGDPELKRGMLGIKNHARDRKKFHGKKTWEEVLTCA